jgi:AraC-like DNA-binding protein
MPPTADGGIARRAVARCREAGIDPLPFLPKASLTADELNDAQVRIRAASQVALLNQVAKAIDDDLLGFHLAKTADLREAGLIYFVLASSATFGEALERARRYSTIANEALRLECLAGGEVGIRYSCVGIPRHTDRHQIEFWMTAFVRIARELTAARIVPVWASLVHLRSSGSAELEAFFGCPITFGAEEDIIIYSRGLDDHPLLGADPYLHELLVGYCEQALAHRHRPAEALRTLVENAITPLLPHGKTQVSEVAHALGLSQRTLARRLAADGLTFSKILDELRVDLARRYLTEPALTISQIAWLLGFQEVSAFTHAFRRWTGQTPTQARSEAAAMTRAANDACSICLVSPVQNIRS